MRPALFASLILVGTGPRGGEGMASLTPEAQQIFGATYEEPDHSGSPFISPSRKQARRLAATSSSGSACAKRTETPRSTKRSHPPNSRPSGKWGTQFDGAYDYLKSIRQPTLVVNGGKDVIIYSVNSFILQQQLPNAQLILYPDANHGSQYQYPELFVRHASMFLSAAE